MQKLRDVYHLVILCIVTVFRLNIMALGVSDLSNVSLAGIKSGVLEEMMGIVSN